MEKTKQSGGKRLKFSDGEQNMASIDRLSSLPDVVICHILSFLETKFSVATSVLGKRWRFLWAHVPCLDFYDDDFRDETQTSDIIHRVLLRHKAKTMDTFTLNVSCNDYQLETLITTAIDRNIRNLYLEHSLDRFPRYLFNCKTIVDLKLDDGCPSLSAVDNVSLPSLKKLYIFNLICENDDALPHFLSGCPSLEELNLAFEFAEESIYVGCINISSPTIKMLQLSMGMYALEYRVIINAPALRYLEVYDYDLECMTIPITMISLVEADICFDNYWFSKHKRKYSSTVMKFLHSLCYVKCLKISGSGFEKYIRRGLARSNVKFDNLTKLELRLNFEGSLLVKFLEVADNLGVLILNLHMVSLWTEPKQVPKCLLSCLRTIRINSMRFKEHEFDMVRYLLRNSRVLETIEIFTPTYECIDLQKKYQALKRISLFERGSIACQLAFLPDSE